MRFAMHSLVMIPIGITLKFIYVMRHIEIKELTLTFHVNNKLRSEDKGFCHDLVH